MTWFRPSPAPSPWVSLLAPWAGQWVTVSLRGSGCCMEVTGRLRIDVEGLHVGNEHGDTLVRWDDVVCVTQLNRLEQERLTLDAMQRATEARQA